MIGRRFRRAAVGERRFPRKFGDPHGDRPMSAWPLLLCAAARAWPPSAAVAPAHRLRLKPSSLNLLASPSDEQRREKLRQLFGDQTAERVVPKSKSEQAEEMARQQALDTQMLEDGIQRLEWGLTRLLDVDMAPGPLEANLMPLVEGSELLCVRLDLPLGMLLEEIPSIDDSVRTAAVVELFDIGSAITSGVRKGDVVRATTACKMGMSTPTWQLMLGGIGRPTMQKVMFVTDGQPFETVLAAISSNSREQQGNGQIVIFLERRPGDE